MLKNRVVPVLLLENEGLVKTTKFKNPVYIGDPINAIRIFNDKEVDELIVLDISASRNNKEPDYSLIQQFASECFMPICYGGGISTVEQARRIFNLGIEKISIQSSALDSMDLIRSLTKEFGRQSIIVSVDVKKNWLKKYKLYSSKEKKTLDGDWLLFIEEALDNGAGEILVNSVDRDGTMLGMDLDLIKSIGNNINIPLIAAGGVGKIDDIKHAIDAGADAVAVGAFFVFQGPHRAVLITYPKYKELERLLNSK